MAESSIEHEKGELNAFYLPDFLKHLRQLIKEFPLWTGVMIPHFHSVYEHASSSYCEGHFNDLKTRVMTKFGKPLRADKFLKMHLQDLNGGAKIFSSKLINYRVTNQVPSDNSKLRNKNKINAGIISCENEDLDNLDLMAVEKWRNKGSKVQSANTMQEEILELNLLENEEFNTNQVYLEGLPSTTNNVEVSENDNENTGPSDFCSELISPEAMEMTSSVQNPASIHNEAPESIKKRSKYFRPYPEIGLKNILNSIKKAYLLKNGNISKPILMEKVKMMDGKLVQRKLIINNTCVFDSIVQVLLTSALDCEDYKGIIEKSKNETLQFVLQFMEHGPNVDVLKSRAMILKPLYSSTLKSVLEVGGVAIIEALDTWDNVANLWDKLMHSESSAYITQECSDESCPTNRTGLSFLVINHKTIAQHGFNSLQKAVQFNSSVKSSKCKNGDCHGRCTISQRENYHLLIELDVRINVTANSGLRCKLKDFPKILQLPQINFRLTGIIAYRPGHYMAYCKRLDGHWEIYDDIEPSVGPVTSNTEIEPHAALYIKV